jgi:hypothetical protein
MLDSVCGLVQRFTHFRRQSGLGLGLYRLLGDVGNIEIQNTCRER